MQRCATPRSVPCLVAFVDCRPRPVGAHSIESPPLAPQLNITLCCPKPNSPKTFVSVLKLKRQCLTWLQVENFDKNFNLSRSLQGTKHRRCYGLGTLRCSLPWLPCANSNSLLAPVCRFLWRGVCLAFHVVVLDGGVSWTCVTLAFARQPAPCTTRLPFSIEPPSPLPPISR